MKIFRSVLAALVLILAVDAQSATILYSDSTAFLAALPPGQVSTYDFETNSGFPAAGAGAASYVGSLGAVTFIGITHDEPEAPSGTQVFSGVDVGFSCCFGIAAIDFTSLPEQPYAVGFFGGDLIEDEIIRVHVGFSDGSNSSYELSLGALPAFTDVFFGLVDSERRVRVLQIFGANAATPDTANRAWYIDDLTTAAVPLPATWAMLGAGFAALAGRVRRRGISARS